MLSSNLFLFLTGFICGIGSYLLLESPNILYILAPFFLLLLKKDNHIIRFTCIGLILGFSRISYRVYSLTYSHPDFTSFQGTITKLTPENGFYKTLIKLKDKNQYIRTKLKINNNLDEGNYISGNIKLYGIPGPCLPEAKDMRYRSFFDRVISYGKIESYVTASGKITTFKKRLSEYIENNFSHNAGALLKSLAIGQSNYISQDIRQKLQDVGLPHILAISGLHIAMVALFFYLFFRWFVCLFIFKYINRATSLSAYFSVIGIVVYFSTISISITAVRSISMFLFPFVSYFTFRKTLPSHSLMSSILIVLCIWPESLIYLEFQLSCLAVFSLMNFSFRKKNYFVSIILGTFICFITMPPFLIYWFNSISLQPFLANLICIPFMFILMPIIIIWLFFHKVGFSFAFLDKILSFLLEFMIDLFILLSDLFTNVAKIHQIHFSILIFWVIGMLFLLHKNKYIESISVVFFIPFFISISRKPKNMFIISNMGEIAILENKKLYALNETFSTQCWAKTLGAELIISDEIKKYFDVHIKNNKVQQIKLYNGTIISRQHLKSCPCKIYNKYSINDFDYVRQK